MPFVPPRSLYVHVPLCSAKCCYCDFFSLPVPDFRDCRTLVEATLARARVLAARFGTVPEGFGTVYVGGGTPTALPPGEFRALLLGISTLAPAPREFTVEANPESLDAAAIDAMRDAGVTRLSLGIQSLDEETLRGLGRRAGTADIDRALALAGKSGLAISADLIAGPPRRQGLAAEAASLIDRGVGHLSVYDLVLEEGTELASRVARGEWKPQDEDEREDGRAVMEALLEARGFRRYEVSNYAPPGAESLHNLAYWRMDSYLGAGPGAVSTIAESIPEGDPGSAAGGIARSTALRIEESRSLAGYGPSAGAREERMAPREAAFEVVMMAFRTRFGLDVAAFRRRFGIGIGELFGETLGAWAARLVPGDPDPGRAGAADGETDGAAARGSPAIRWQMMSRIALDPRGLDRLNAFLIDCLGELERNSPDAGSQTKKS